MWFFFKMCFHFQKVFMRVVFLFLDKHNCKQKYVHSLKIALLMRLWTNNQICIKLLDLCQLSRICNLLYHWWIIGTLHLQTFNHCESLQSYWQSRYGHYLLLLNIKRYILRNLSTKNYPILCRMTKLNSFR